MILSILCITNAMYGGQVTEQLNIFHWITKKDNEAPQCRTRTGKKQNINQQNINNVSQESYTVMVYSKVSDDDFYIDIINQTTNQTMYTCPMSKKEDHMIQMNIMANLLKNSDINQTKYYLDPNQTLQQNSPLLPILSIKFDKMKKNKSLDQLNQPNQQTTIIPNETQSSSDSSLSLQHKFGIGIIFLGFCALIFMCFKK